MITLPTIKKCLNALIALIALMPTVLVPSTTAAAATLPDLEAADTVMDGYFSHMLLSEGVPGAVVAIVDKSGHVYLRGYGFSDAARTKPMKPQRNLFRLASQTKLFTALAIMQLYDRGLIDLDSDANRYLRAAKIPDGYGAAVTVRNLLQHTSGVADSYYRMLIKSPALHQPLSAWFRKNGIQRIRRPGLVVDYNNRDFAILGLIVEEVSGEVYEDYIQNHILTPLGMSSTTFILDSRNRSDMAEGTYHSAGHLVTAIVPDSLERPAGDLISSALDMSRFLTMLLNEGEFEGRQVLSMKSARTMLDDCFVANSALSWCLGIARISSNAEPMLRHPGGYYTYKSSIWLFPESGIAVFLAINGGAEIAGSFIRTVAPALVRFDPVLAAMQDPYRGGGGQGFAGAYRPEILNHSIDKLTYLLIGDTQLVSCSRDSICVGHEKFAQTGPREFQNPSNAAAVTFSVDLTTRAQYATIQEFTYRKVTPWEQTTVHRWLIAAALVLLMASAPASITALLRRGGRRQLRVARVTLALIPNLLWPVSVGAIFAWAASASELSVVWDFDWGLPGYLTMVVWTVRIAAVLSLIWMGAIACWLWARSPQTRWLLIINGASGVALSLFANYWNLLF